MAHTIKDLRGVFVWLLALPVLAVFASGFVWDVFFNPRPPATVTLAGFHFEDFGTHPDSQLALQRALRSFFPAGTAKADIEALLVDKAGARRRGQSRKAIYSHAAPSFFPLLCHPTWNVFASYDADMILEDLSVQRLCYSARAADEPLPPEGTKAWRGKGSF